MPNLLKSPCAGGSPTKPKSPHSIFAPENASLAQGLLQAMLQNAKIELFAPGGGGIALVRLERWQIDLLEKYEVGIEQLPVVPRATQGTQKKVHTLQAEYLAFDQNMLSPALDSYDVSRKKSQTNDILSGWLLEE